MQTIALFGVRSPLLPDYEESCARLGVEVVAAVRADGLRPRILDRSGLIDLANLDESHKHLAYLACAFYPKRRHELVKLADAAGLSPADAIIDPTAIIASSTRLGRGTYVNAGSVIGSAGVIGDHVFVNRSTNIGHHAHLSDYSSIGPGVTMAGNVNVGSHGFVGAGSVILPGVRIGDGAVVAAGSVVKDDVSSGVFVAGVPARLTRHRLSANMLGREGEE